MRATRAVATAAAARALRPCARPCSGAAGAAAIIIFHYYFSTKESNSNSMVEDGIDYPPPDETGNSAGALSASGRVDGGKAA